MNVLAAAYNVVSDYRGGAAALAPLLGKSGSTLSHEVSPNCAHAKLGMLDAVKITAFTGDWRILQAFAAEVGALVVPIHSNAGGEADTLAALGQMAKEFAELVSATGETMADGLVSDNELARLERETGDLVQAAQRVLGLARARNEAGRA
jgi:hypothetical protein